MFNYLGQRRLIPGRPRTQHGHQEGFDRFLLCPNKPPTQLSPSDFPVSKIRIYFPAYFNQNINAATVTKPNNNHQSLPNNTNNSSNSSHKNHRNHHFNHHHNKEQNYDTFTTSASSYSATTTSPPSSTRTIKPKITETDVDESDYTDAASLNASSEENFIEILFHFPNYKYKNPSF